MGHSPIFEKQTFNHNQKWALFIFIIIWLSSLRWRQDGLSVAPSVKLRKIWAPRGKKARGSVWNAKYLNLVHPIVSLWPTWCGHRTASCSTKDLISRHEGQASDCFMGRGSSNRIGCQGADLMRSHFPFTLPLFEAPPANDELPQGKEDSQNALIEPMLCWHQENLK